MGLSPEFVDPFVEGSDIVTLKTLAVTEGNWPDWANGQKR